MYYYKIALPLNTPEALTYKSKEKISPGTRVLISVYSAYHTGIVWKQDDKVVNKIKYKEIHEVIDDNPLLPQNLIRLAEWMCTYYHCGIGQIIDAMLPLGAHLEMQLSVSKFGDKENIELNETEQKILDAIDNDNFKVEKLRKKIAVQRLQYWLENLENKGYIKIHRKFDEKIKKKVVNYVIVLKQKDDVKLTKKQTEAYEYFCAIGSEFPLAKVAKEYSYSIIKALREKGKVKIEPREIEAEDSIKKIELETKKIVLTNLQNAIISQIISAMDEEIFCVKLLHGITGSGKTEVYIDVIKNALKKDKTALMLVPEISLTPQIIARFTQAFEEEIAILHSHMSDRNRWEQWLKIRQQRCRIVIGARSAIFAPLQDIGIIIVDEEHELSYKQDSTPRYNARDVAIVRAQRENCTVLLGSATPSLESWNNSKQDKFAYIELNERPYKITMPKLNVIDMREIEDPKQLFSSELLNAIEERMERKEQVMLLQNRRGHSSFIQCLSCGKLFRCKYCDISMNFHSRGQVMLCHYCGYSHQMPDKCPECGSYLFGFGAPGTQQLETQLKTIFPSARILRMDSDTARSRDSYDAMFERMHKGTVDILLGTQMIAKGLDFSNVTLVGVVSADIGLNIPDFRAAERTFQLITQVAGRSGRAHKAGEVIIQSHNPEHYAIKMALAQNYENFAKHELNLRKMLFYSPYFRLGRFLFAHKHKKVLELELNKNKPVLDMVKDKFKRELIILGPVPAPIEKINTQYRYHIIIKAGSVSILHKAITLIKNNLNHLSTIRQTIDVDPGSLM